MSLWGTIAKIGGFAAAPFTGGLSIPIGQAVGGAADALGATGQAAAQNRGAQINTALQGQQVANQTNQQNINDRQSAWKDLLHTDYILNNNQGYKPATMQSSVPGMAPHVLPSFGIARAPFGSGAIQGAQGMQNETLHRLTGGPQLHMPDVNKMAKPSAWEKIVNIAAPAMKFAGGALNFGGGGSSGGSGSASSGSDDSSEYWS